MTNLFSRPLQRTKKTSSIKIIIKTLYSFVSKKIARELLKNSQLLNDFGSIFVCKIGLNFFLSNLKQR